MIFPLALALVTSGASACPLAEPATRAGLILAEQRWVAALEARDAPALACRLAPGFSDTSWRGELIGRDEILSALPNRPPTRLALSEMTAEVRGRIGIVHGVNTQIGPDGQTVGRVRFTDLFMRRKGRWQAIAAQETLIGPAGVRPHLPVS